MNTLQRKYYRQVKKEIPNKVTRKKELLKILEYSLSSFFQCHSNAIYSDYINNFGTPKEYADILLEEWGTDNLIKSLRSKNKLIFIIFIGIFLIFIPIIICRYCLRHTIVGTTLK